MVRFQSLLLAAALSCLGPATVFAQEKSGIRPGFEVAQISGQSIIMFRPDIQVGEQSTGGLFEPNADWTMQARALLGIQLRAAQGKFANRVIPVPELVGDDAALVAEYQALFNLVSDSIIHYQFFKGNRLPTRKNRAFDWTLGSGIARLGRLCGARYGLFLQVHDEFGSTGRKMLQIFAAAAVGIAVPTGEHKGAAGLVDMQTGNILWLNADMQMGGDVREEEGAAKRVRQLLEDFPGSAAFAAEAK